MFRSISTSRRIAHSKAAVAAAALVAGLASFLISAAPEARADTPTATVLAKGDRLPMAAKACSLTGWPNYEASCYFDRRTPSTEARAVRIIALR
jgi:hypothetical protein